LRNRIADGAAAWGFAVIALAAVVGVLTDTLHYVAAGTGFLLVTLMLFAYPPRMAAMLFSLQIVLTTAFLSGISIYMGPFRITIDDSIQIWVLVLWLASAADGDSGFFPSSSGRLIGVLVLLSIIAFFRGLAGGYGAENAGIFLKTMLGYLFFFPALWLLNRRENLRLLLSVLIAATFIAAVWIILKGYLGGEGVYVRHTSGLRVTSREVNVVMVGLLLTISLLWKKHRAPGHTAGFILVTVMGASLLLGQSRALWLAVTAGALVALLADVSALRKKGPGPGPVISRILLLCVFAAGSVAFVHAAGLLTPADVAARGGGAEGGLAGDLSLWARFLSWWEIIRTVTSSPLTLLFGTGFGHRITYFRPDLFGVVSIPYVDGSFFQLLLNTGLSGMTVLAMLYAGGIARSFRLVQRTGSPSTVILGMWLAASFTALTIAAFASSVITNYRFTCIWAFLFAVMESEIRRNRENG
jgi:hypothetical protein